MNFEWIFSKELFDAVESKQPLIMKGVVTCPKPTWDDFINCIESIGERPSVEGGNKYLKDGGVIVHKVPSEKPWDKYKEIVNELWKTHSVQAKYHTEHLYASLCSWSQTFGMHNDTANVFYIQLIGQVCWTVVSSNKGTIVETLEPGDVIYVPRHMNHSTRPWGPRLGLSIGLDYGYNK